MIIVNNISKAFQNEKVLQSISFELAPNKVLSILGKSGCGKTTLLKIMAGLTTPDSGTFMFNDKNIFDLTPQKRETVYLSQEPLLFPHLSVFENIAFGLRIKKEKKSVVQQKTAELLKKIGLSEHKNKFPEMLSGGQKQRVAFGRALIINPKLMLLDEPFGSLDTQTKSEMQTLFKNVAKEYNITAVFVTHDLKESLIMGDEIGQMDKGELKIYANKLSFYNDSNSGVKEEINFWKKLI